MPTQEKVSKTSKNSVNSNLNRSKLTRVQQIYLEYSLAYLEDVLHKLHIYDAFTIDYRIERSLITKYSPESYIPDNRL